MFYKTWLFYGHGQISELRPASSDLALLVMPDTDGAMPEQRHINSLSRYGPGRKEMTIGLKAKTEPVPFSTCAPKSTSYFCGCFRVCSAKLSAALAIDSTKHRSRADPTSYSPPVESNNAL